MKCWCFGEYQTPKAPKPTKIHSHVLPWDSKQTFLSSQKSTKVKFTVANTNKQPWLCQCGLLSGLQALAHVRLHWCMSPHLTHMPLTLRYMLANVCTCINIQPKCMPSLEHLPCESEIDHLWSLLLLSFCVFIPWKTLFPQDQEVSSSLADWHTISSFFACHSYSFLVWSAHFQQL